VIVTLGLSLGISLGYQSLRHKPVMIVALLAGMLTIAMSVRFAKENAEHRPYESLRNLYMDAPEYVPAYAQKEYYQVVRFGEVNKHAPAVIYDQSAGRVALIRKGPERQVYSVNLTRPTKVIFHQFYWPQWQLWRGDYPVSVGYDEYGRAVAELETGSYQLEMKLIATDGQTIGAMLSGLGAAVLTGLISLTAIVRRKLA